jgi:hypothetical protein
MSQPNTSVNPADLRRAAGQVRDAARELNIALNEESWKLTTADPTGWATVASMNACSTAVITALLAHHDALNGNADALDKAADEYVSSDYRSADRQRGD